jgi:hypothetical protein
MKRLFGRTLCLRLQDASENVRYNQGPGYVEFHNQQSDWQIVEKERAQLGLS